MSDYVLHADDRRRLREIASWLAHNQRVNATAAADFLSDLATRRKASTPQHSVLEELAEEFEKDAANFRETAKECDRSGVWRHEADRQRVRAAVLGSIAKRLREKAANLPSEGREEAEKLRDERETEFERSSIRTERDIQRGRAEVAEAKVRELEAALQAERERVREVIGDLRERAASAEQVRDAARDPSVFNRAHGKARAYAHAAEMVEALYPEQKEDGR